MSLRIALALFTLSLTACHAPRSSAPTQLRVVAYNVKHGLGMDGQLDLARIARVLEALEPDVVLLQEIDEFADRSGGVDQARFLGEALGMSHHFAPFMDFDGGRYGLATLARPRVLEAEVIELPPGEREPRSALRVTLEVDGRPLHLFNAHLDWLRDDTRRVAQAEALGAAIRDAGAGGDALLLGGDLNDVPGSPALRTLETLGSLERFGPDAPTFQGEEGRTIDHFLGRGVRPVAPPEVIDERVASDHFPIRVELGVN